MATPSTHDAGLRSPACAHLQPGARVDEGVDGGAFEGHNLCRSEAIPQGRVLRPQEHCYRSLKIRDGPMGGLGSPILHERPVLRLYLPAAPETALRALRGWIPGSLQCAGIGQAPELPVNTHIPRLKQKLLPMELLCS